MYFTEGTLNMFTAVLDRDVAYVPLSGKPLDSDVTTGSDLLRFLAREAGRYTAKPSERRSSNETIRSARVEEAMTIISSAEDLRLPEALIEKTRVKLKVLLEAQMDEPEEEEHPFPNGAHHECRMALIEQVKRLAAMIRTACPGTPLEQLSKELTATKRTDARFSVASAIEYLTEVRRILSDHQISSMGISDLENSSLTKIVYDNTNVSNAMKTRIYGEGADVVIDGSVPLASNLRNASMKLKGARGDSRAGNGPRSTPKPRIMTAQIAQRSMPECRRSPRLKSWITSETATNARQSHGSP